MSADAPHRAFVAQSWPNAAIDAEGDGTAIAARAIEDWLVTAEPLPTKASQQRLDATDDLRLNIAERRT